MTPPLGGSHHHSRGFTTNLGVPRALWGGLTLLVFPSLWHLGHSQQLGISSLMMPSALPI